MIKFMIFIIMLFSPALIAGEYVYSTLPGQVGGNLTKPDKIEFYKSLPAITHWDVIFNAKFECKGFSFCIDSNYLIFAIPNDKKLESWQHGGYKFTLLGPTEFNYLGTEINGVVIISEINGDKRHFIYSEENGLISFSNHYSGDIPSLYFVTEALPGLK
ncbi:hypothetical protein [Ferrimonas balearica]|uniref:hypothetical protein n=1 Tax=Ferrimonas balearica TaxID=44012 RepID=UPI001C99BA2C|nr:hypothetical protein [Ferrimonas balearica]MBY5922263.1 hypothetical protein [Ferrimonas balearica]MBY5994397.1 hypothetical protein [Ferrimonas balearica]